MLWALVLLVNHQSVDHIDGYANLQMCEVAVNDLLQIKDIDIKNTFVFLLL